MNLKIESKLFEVNFVREFKHASASRGKAQSVLIKLLDENGIVGYGEACPRHYVTSETPESVELFLKDNVALLSQINDFSLLKEEASNIWKNKGGQAAWCAYELAWLDLFSKRNRLTIDQYLGYPVCDKTFKFSAVLGIEKPESFIKSVEVYKSLEFLDFKLKLEGNFENDNKRIVLLSEIIGPDLRLRLDANNCYNSTRDAIENIERFAYRAWAIEEPLRLFEGQGLVDIAKALNIKIILDESCSTEKELDWALQHSSHFIVNLRISKFGGLVNSLEVCRRAAAASLDIILGCHVGESSISTRAALVVASAFPNLIIAQEGAFGTMLLSSDVVSNPIMFSKAGILKEHPSFRQFGFGLDVRW